MKKNLKITFFYLHPIDKHILNIHYQFIFPSFTNPSINVEIKVNFASNEKQYLHFICEI